MNEKKLYLISIDPSIQGRCCVAAVFETRTPELVEMAVWDTDWTASSDPNGFHRGGEICIWFTELLRRCLPDVWVLTEDLVNKPQWGSGRRRGMQLLNRAGDACIHAAQLLGVRVDLVDPARFKASSAERALYVKTILGYDLRDRFPVVRGAPFEHAIDAAYRGLLITNYQLRIRN